MQAEFLLGYKKIRRFAKKKEEEWCNYKLPQFVGVWFFWVIPLEIRNISAVFANTDIILQLHAQGNSWENRWLLLIETTIGKPLSYWLFQPHVHAIFLHCYLVSWCLWEWVWQSCGCIAPEKLLAHKWRIPLTRKRTGRCKIARGTLGSKLIASAVDIASS